MMNTPHPPKFFLRFFRWFCHPKLKNYIEGDLLELYHERLAQKGKTAADVRFMLDVLLLLRPSIIKPTEGYQHVNTYGMYKNYAKVGWRNLVRHKSYSLINVAGLALSMTCAIFIFSLVKQHLAFDNFHHNPENTYRIVTEMHRDNVSFTSSVPSPLGNVFRNDYAYGETVARIFTDREVLITLRKENSLTKFKEQGGIAFTETTFFDIFNFPMQQGSAASLKEPGKAILTERMAHKYFGDENPIGQTIWLDNSLAFSVSGILKDLPQNTNTKSEIFVSYASLKEYDPWLGSETRGWGGIRDGMECYAVLKPGTSTAKVEEVLSAYVKVHRPTSKNVHHYKLQPLSDIHFNAQYGGAMAKSKLWMLATLGLFLIATACVNFINLATAQALRRAREVGVRKVLGSFKAQLFWQFILETGIITVTAVLIALLAAYSLVPFVNNLFKTDLTVNFFSDGLLLLFVFGLAFAVTFLAGFYPGLVLTTLKPVQALKGKVTQQQIGGFNTRRALIVAQFTISQILIIGMMVTIHQMNFARYADLGFDKDAIVMVKMGTDSTGRSSAVLKKEIARIPGVEKITRCFTAPSSSDDWGNSIRIDNATEEVNFRTSIKSADADYVSTFNLQLVAGRDLVPSDTVREVLVNETLVEKLGLSPEEALGHSISANGGSMKGPIVGVVKDFHDKSFHQDINAILITTSQEDYNLYAVKLNMANAKNILAAIEKSWLQQHPDQIFEYSFLDDDIRNFYEAEETMLKLIQVFSGIAIFIGALGLYGLVSFMVAQKTKEIGIRKILGSTVSSVTWIFGKEFLRLILIAFVISAPIGWWLMRSWLQGFKFQVPIHYTTFMSAFISSLVIAAITVSYRVIKTARANPVESLRSE